MRTKPEFEHLNIGASALQNAFYSQLKAVLQKYGIEKEQVNLSGLASEPSEYEKLLLEMAEEDYKETRKRKNDAEKAKQKKKLNNIITAEGLAKQGTLGNPELLAAASVENSDSPSAVSSSVESSGSGFSSINVLQQLSKTIAKSISGGTAKAEEDRELDRELKRAQIRAANAQEEYYKRLRV